MKRLVLILLLAAPAAFGQRPSVQQSVGALTEVMYHDVVNPPAAARFYAYALLAGYESLGPERRPLAGFSDRFRNFPAPLPHPQGINDTLAALYTIMETGRGMMPSGYLLEEKELELVKAFAYLASDELNASLDWARRSAKRMVQYARGDGYFALSTLRRYQPVSGVAYWQPTPPEYMSAVEPNWRTIRPFFLDSAGQCKPPPMSAFDSTKGSAFYELARDVYDVSKNLTAGQRLIANFWDCNPFAVQYEGHMSVGLKKISPGGHWIGITGIACTQAALDLQSTLLLHTLVALTLHDAFICCWDEKYRTNRIRPETAVNRYIDEHWQPLLQTPPFPEYPSGHSVISTAVAAVLTQFLGDHFAFTDTVEMYIGLPSRRFSSFAAAAAEARISRLYGGIHFRDAVENGAIEGADIGKLVISRSGAKPLRP